MMHNLPETENEERNKKLKRRSTPKRVQFNNIKKPELVCINNNVTYNTQYVERSVGNCEQTSKRGHSPSKALVCDITHAQHVCINTSSNVGNHQHTLDEIESYRNIADKIQTKVYNSDHSPPSEICLDECKDYISLKLDKRRYDEKFAIYEGQADTLRTCKHIEKDLCNHQVYDCLKLLAPYTSFPGIAMMIYTFRTNKQSVQDAKKKADEGVKTLEPYLSETKMARVNVSCLYGYTNVLLAAHDQKIPTEQTENIQEWIEKGLEQVKSIEICEVANMWTRMFLVKKALYLLRIGLSGEDISDQDAKDITEEARDSARRCLEKADEHWTYPDKRRRMLYKRAEAKLRWLDGDRQNARDSMKQAIKLASHFKREEQSFQHVLLKWRL
ncbi:uncharacterized protein [Argopecten irradians]|uniref:uncharacterized protein n=1 Tax=Argopecten irradians TaxID=31199 RepID=UPI003718828C